MSVTIAFARAQIDAGADCLLPGDHATRDPCSPEAYEQFLLPIHGRIAQEISVPVILHICGYAGDRINTIARTGLDCFHWDTRTGPPEQVRQLAGPKLALMGGISNHKLLTDTPETIAADAAHAARSEIDICPTV